MSRLAAAVSGLILLATLALWVRSYWRLDEVSTRQRMIQHDAGAIVTFETLTSSWGGLKLSHHQYDHFASPLSPVSGPLLQWHDQPDPSPLVNRAPTILNKLYFSRYRQVAYHVSETERIDGVVVPHWFICLASAICPWIVLRRFLRSRQRMRAGLCNSCGYDLRATPDRCPECGAVAVAIDNGDGDLSRCPTPRS